MILRQLLMADSYNIKQCISVLVLLQDFVIFQFQIVRRSDLAKQRLKHRVCDWEPLKTQSNIIISFCLASLDLPGNIQSSLLENIQCFLPHKFSCLHSMSLGNISLFSRFRKANHTIAFVLGWQVISVRTGKNGRSRHELSTIGRTTTGKTLRTMDHSSDSWIEFGAPIGIDKARGGMEKVDCGFCLAKVSSPTSP